MIDLHSHILPRLDDGARSLDESLAIARAAVREGVTAMAATPHVREDYPTTVTAMERGVAELRRALAAEEIPLDVLPGGEVALDVVPRLSDGDRHGFELGGSTSYLLVEFPYHGWPLALPETLFQLRASGVTPVLAHPERNREVQDAPERLRSLVELGALVQLTAGSIDGREGRRSRDAAFALLKASLAHMVATDAHSPDLRATGFAAARHALGNDELATWLMNDMPAAIVARAPLPPRPQTPRRLGRRGWIRRAAPG